MRHRYSDLIRIFDDLFALTERTVLVAGVDEPLYKPAEGDDRPAQIIFAHGYFASALHEIAHWCIAGHHRRSLLDYGYWYEPDGRSPEKQMEFARVEVKPQALEWVFSVASGLEFNFSADNLAVGGSVVDDSWRHFQCDVTATARRYAEIGLPARAEILASELARFYGTGNKWRDPDSYQLDEHWREPYEIDHRVDAVVCRVSS